MFQYHDLLIILAYGNGIRGRGSVIARRFFGPAIRDPAIPSGGIRGRDDAGRGLLTRRTAVTAHLGIEVRKRRDRC